MIRTCAFAVLLSVTTAACEKVDRSEAELIVPDELKILRSNAFSCWQDSAHAPVEHSEHCVAVAENYFDALREECVQDCSNDCANYDKVLTDIRFLYGDAIIDSLVNFGIPEWIKNDENLTSFSSHAFYDGKLMRRLFDECLKSEARELAKNGLQPATTIMDIPLRDGQKCFRMGHPAFRTQPINNS